MRSNLEIIHWIQNYIESFGLETTLVPNEEKTKTSLHCRIGPSVDGGVILSGHTDVVPVKGQAWDSDPFTLTKKDSKLFGRGSADMKGFIACCLASLPTLIEADLKHIKRGDETLSVDSKSFRNTFIQIMLDKGINSTAIAKNCGTSTTMIDKHYTANSALESILDSWLETGRTKLKRVS